MNERPTTSSGVTGSVSSRPDQLPPGYLNRHEAARYLNVGLSYLAEVTAARKLASVKLGRRRLYRRDDLDDFVESNLDGPS